MTGSAATRAGTDQLADWVSLVHDVYPPGDAADWDAVGVHVGAPDDPVTRVLVCLDVTPAVVDEAVTLGAELILAHHPLLFRPLGRLTPETAAGAVALQAARSGRSVLAAHTNLDVAVGGTSDPVAALLGLVDVEPLVPTPLPGQLMLVTFVPSSDTAAVVDALAAAGAGRIGEYSSCSFRTPGTGTFRPSDLADPAIGARGELNQVGEDRLEMVVDARDVRAVIDALRAAHPYEEVAYQLYPIERRGTGAKGFGRVGRLAEPAELGAVARRIAGGLPSPHLRLAGDPDRPVNRVAVCGGAGDGLIDAAVAAGAELYVTGDLRHHPALDATTRGLALIDAGHYWTEVPAMTAAIDVLAQRAREGGLQAGLLASTVRTDPWVPRDSWARRNPTRST